MSERYGTCRACQGMGARKVYDAILLRTQAIDCGLCGGTGIGGDAMDYMSKEQEKENERDRWERDRPDNGI